MFWQISLITKYRILSTNWTRATYLRQFCTAICDFLNGRSVICTDLHVHRDVHSVLTMFFLTSHTSDNEETEPPPYLWLCCAKHSWHFSVDVVEFLGLEGFLEITWPCGSQL